MNDNTAALRALIDRYVDGLEGPPNVWDRVGIAREGARLLQTIDTDGINILIDALADPRRRSFVYSLYRWSLGSDRSEPGVVSMALRAPMPEELFEPMLMTAVGPLAGGDGWDFVRFVTIAFGYRRTAEFIIDYLEGERSRDEIARAMSAIYGLQLTRAYEPEDRGEPRDGRIRIWDGDFDRDGLRDIYDDVQRLLARLFIRHDDPDLRRAIARWLDANHESVPKELRPVVHAAQTRVATR